MNGYFIKINTSKQCLTLYHNTDFVKSYAISSGANGIGQILGSGQTPLGWHRVAERFGEQAKLNTVFVGRQSTGEIYQPNMTKLYPDRDWILTRILRLEGLEAGLNRGGNVDSYQRMIYIHGTPAETQLGSPGSKGCIRMNNHQLIELFELSPVGTPVYIF